jgi:hypothetical protein
MNVLSDFSIRAKKASEQNNNGTPNVDELLRLLDEKDNLLAQYQDQLTKIRISGASPKKSKSGPKKTVPTPKNEKKKVIHLV